MRRMIRQILVGVAAGGALGGATQALAQQESISENKQIRAVALEEIIVTARKREEKLQEVPDAVTVLTGEHLETAGIRSVPEFMNQIPNLTFQDGSSYRAGALYMTLRGVGNADAGWAPVTYVVDGVPADSLDGINAGTLVDIERIEVLRGPQSALYGAGAIAGAINVITSKPTNDLQLRTKASYAKGNDRRISAVLSGPIVEDKLLYRLSGYYRNSDGLIDSASNGIDLDFAEHKQFSGRFIFTPTDDIELDLRAEFLQEENGATYQEKLPRSAADSAYLLDEWNISTDPRRRTQGVDDREFKRLALKISWDLPIATLTSVTGYNDMDQTLSVGMCWDDPDNPAVDADPTASGIQVGCVLLPALGSAAAPGEFVDNLFLSDDDTNTWTQDVRLASRGEGRFRWLAGVQLLDRETFNGFDGGWTVAPDEHYLSIFERWDVREDSWWGVYSQLSYDLTDKLELTAAARYDENTYKNTQYSDRNKTAIVQATTAQGVLVDTQEEDANKFQPKVQLSYKLRDDAMVYVTWAEGFRAGFFNVGAFTSPESTTNYEGGIKMALLGGRLVTNAAIFHIDYSNQQVTVGLNVPPFRVPTTVPETDIDGAEFESTWLVNSMLTLSASVGYLDSRLAETGVRPPYVSEWTGTASANFEYPLSNAWNMRLYGDYRYHSDLYLQVDENPTSRVPPKDFVNLRAGLANSQWQVFAFVKNAFDTREAVRVLADQGATIGGILRGPNQPRSYGVELGYSF